MTDVRIGGNELTAPARMPFVRDDVALWRAKPGVGLDELRAAMDANMSDDVLLRADDGALFIVSAPELALARHLGLPGDLLGRRFEADGVKGTVVHVSDSTALAGLSAKDLASAAMITVGGAAYGASLGMSLAINLGLGTGLEAAVAMGLTMGLTELIVGATVGSRTDTSAAHARLKGMLE